MSPVYEPMTYEELSELYRVEMNSGALSRTRADLFKAMAELLNRLRGDYERELTKDPESLMCEGANTRRKKADLLVKEIINLRSKKICAMALRAVTGAGNSLDAMTEEEKDLYERLCSTLSDHAGTVDFLRGRRQYMDTRLDEEPAEEPVEAPAEEPVVTKHAPVAEEPKPAPEPVEIPEEEPVDDFEPFDDPADMPGEFPDDSDAVFMTGMQEASKPAPEPTADDMDTMVLLRVLEDLPPFVGPDRDYELTKEDLITIPKVMADALVRMEKAVVVKPTPRERFASSAS
jgi:DNA replication factor GINS